MKFTPLLLFLTGALPIGAQSLASAKSELSIDAVLEPIRIKYHLPALAGAIVTSKGLAVLGAVGMRIAGEDTPVTIDDEWHLGSDTKAMTATMIGRLVEAGQLHWDTSIEQVFPKIAPSLPPAFRGATLLELLSHQAGLPHGTGWREIALFGGSLHNQPLIRVHAQSPMGSP